MAPGQELLSSRPRNLRKRRRVEYQEDDSDVGLDSLATTRSPRPRRRSARIETYTVSAQSSGDSSNDSAEHQPGEGRSQKPDASSVTLSTRRGVPKREVPPNPPSVSNRPPGDRTRKPRTKDDCRKSGLEDRTVQRSKRGQSTKVTVRTSRSRPPWQSLEHQILVKVVQDAALSMSDGNSLSSPAVAWLTKLSLLCKSLHQAAVAVLLHTPPLFTLARAQNLFSTLRQPQESLTTNFRYKIRRLEVDVKNIVARKRGINLPDLIPLTPLLADLRLYHPFDDIHAVWATVSASRAIWAYPDALFDAMDENGICLKAFELNSRFTVMPAETLESLCHRRSFRSLTKLVLRNIDDSAASSALSVRQTLAGSINDLPHLKVLAFRDCNIVNANLLGELNISLHTITFHNCGNLTSDSLEQFLVNNGKSIIELNLAANQALDLAFMASMAGYTPMLRSLIISLTYADPSAFRDVRPHFKRLFPNPEVPPTWPVALENVELLNLRNTSLSEVEGFVTSLSDAACSLPYLRYLTMKAILPDVNWRERAQCRQKWQTVLEKAFTSQEPAILNRPGTRAGWETIRSGRNPYAHTTPREGVELVTQGSRRSRHCNIFLTIDAQRIADVQYGMRDFLDAETSDEEWTH